MVISITSSGSNREIIIHNMKVNNRETHDETMRVERTVGLVQPVVSGVLDDIFMTDINH